MSILQSYPLAGRRFGGVAPKVCAGTKQPGEFGRADGFCYKVSLPRRILITWPPLTLGLPSEKQRANEWIMFCSFAAAVVFAGALVPLSSAVPLRVRADQVGTPGDAKFDYVGT